MAMFIDWLTVHQDYDYQLPLVGERFSVWYDTASGEQLTQPRTGAFKHEGSYSTMVQVSVNGNRLRVDGNPSRFNRLDNLFGFPTVDECIRVYNHLLLSLGLPPFTRCTRTFQRQGDDGKRSQQVSDGAVIERIDITTNKAVGQGSVGDYLRAVSALKYKNMVPQLYSNGCTTSWETANGGNRMQYPSMYDKANELESHILPKAKRLFGIESREYQYLKNLHGYCVEHGVVRCEQKLHSEFLRRERLAFWGLSDMTKLNIIHQEFLDLDGKLQVTSMDFENISQRLISAGVVDTTKAANTTAMYAIQWMHGQAFDLSKKQVQTHRARLRKIGIDIGLACDLSRFSPIYVKQCREVEVKPLAMPDWYIAPAVPTLRAA